MAKNSVKSTGKKHRAISPQLAAEMNSFFDTARSSIFTQRVWDEIFTPHDKHQLGKTLTKAYKDYVDLPRMWMKVRGGTLSRAVVEILAALELISPKKRRTMLQQLGEEGEDSEETMELAIKSGCLVLATSPGLAYWMTEHVDVDWNRNPVLWDYFFAVCKASKCGGRVDEFVSFEGSPRMLTNWKHRLLKIPGFPQTLADEFGTRTFANQLKLPPGEIRIFERSVQDEFAEWGVKRIGRG